jgi:hypothetical protein
MKKDCVLCEVGTEVLYVMCEICGGEAGLWLRALVLDPLETLGGSQRWQRPVRKENLSSSVTYNVLHVDVNLRQGTIIGNICLQSLSVFRN